MGQVQTHTASAPGSLPVQASRELLDLTAKIYNRLESESGHYSRRSLSAVDAPTDLERADLERRRQHLEAALTPTPANLMSTVSSLLGAFPSFGISLDAAKKHATMVCRALSDCPTWAVNEAAARFIQGKNRTEWNAEKAPTAPQIHAEAKTSCVPLEIEIARITEILRAEVYQPMSTADRAKMDKAIAEWTAKRAVEKGQGRQAETQDEFEARLREIGRLDGLTLSEAAR